MSGGCDTAPPQITASENIDKLLKPSRWAELSVWLTDHALVNKMESNQRKFQISVFSLHTHTHTYAHKNTYTHTCMSHIHMREDKEPTFIKSIHMQII